MIVSTCARIDHLSRVYKTSAISFADVENHFSFMSYKIVKNILGVFQVHKSHKRERNHKSYRAKLLETSIRALQFHFQTEIIINGKYCI